MVSHTAFCTLAHPSYFCGGWAMENLLPAGSLWLCVAVSPL